MPSVGFRGAGGTVGRGGRSREMTMPIMLPNIVEAPVTDREAWASCPGINRVPNQISHRISVCIEISR